VKPSSLIDIIKGMKVIPREARRITYSSEIRKLKNIPLTDEQRAIVVGAILGDACLSPNWSLTNHRLQITRSKQQQVYIEWQYGKFKPFVLTKPRWYERTRSYTIRTISHQEFSNLRKEFYPQGIKILPDRIEEYLQNPLTLAVWFMDDGNAVIRNGKVVGYHLNTQSFTKEENQKIARLFEELFGIRFVIEKNNGSYRIGVWQKDSREMFRNLIDSHIIPSMRYKLGLISDSSSPVETGFPQTGMKIVEASA